MEQFTENVIKIIEGIPSGRVMTYGQIAKIAGNTKGARQVSWILHRMSKKYSLPWHRVINSKGEISFPGEKALFQKRLLEDEKVEFNQSNKVNLHTYGYVPNREFI
ncbi:Methylated-DNA--protein-cysteine methyltransferase [Paraliobacillus sp. PM-2]|uniref:MGMT family protein n=1 Tax=Paraliobacillus sp. PM-2 TaxID=1462524 RepID=UPI00061BB736|nr:MGMT family protein [Paraliobacillus sp. PM-2]CQR47072.1 Methylated-DNA--protein-cysteine methyltransferase [Paraliobacillus sp. PM-2]